MANRPFTPVNDPPQGVWLLVGFDKADDTKILAAFRTQESALQGLSACGDTAWLEYHLFREVVN
jgi:hypothetical protein